MNERQRRDCSLEDRPACHRASKTTGRLSLADTSGSRVPSLSLVDLADERQNRCTV